MIKRKKNQKHRFNLQIFTAESVLIWGMVVKITALRRVYQLPTEAALVSQMIDIFLLQWRHVGALSHLE